KINLPPDYDTDNIPLLLASKYRDIEITKLLLDSKADPNSRDMLGNTALHVLAFPLPVPCPYRDGPEIAKLLISRGAKMTRNSGEEGGAGDTPLSCLKSNLNIIQSNEAAYWRDLPFYNELLSSFKSLAEIYGKL
ncbi:MAG: ankyrin repeat domain-containing protein, partial [Bacteroidales bacterium]|nr:ankyrin repeat domain-containing protein [Bacteroidales bacterium]